MRQSTITWPKLLAAFVLFLVASIVFWILHVLLHDSVGISLLLLSLISALAFVLTAFFIVIKLLKLILQKG